MNVVFTFYFRDKYTLFYGFIFFVQHFPLEFQHLKENIWCLIDDKIVSEFNEFKSRLKSPKNWFQSSSGLNLKKFNTNLSGTNRIWPPDLNFSRGSNSLISASGYLVASLFFILTQYKMNMYLIEWYMMHRSTNIHSCNSVL